MVKRVLVVDDAIFMRLTVRKVLESNGYEVVGEADNGYKAIEAYKLLKPEIVTMDVTMPEMDGIGALTEIMKYDSNAKIIMLSAIGQEPKIREAVSLGAREFIIKPFKEEDLIKVLNRF